MRLNLLPGWSGVLGTPATTRVTIWDNDAGSATNCCWPCVCRRRMRRPTAPCRSFWIRRIFRANGVFPGSPSGAAAARSWRVCRLATTRSSSSPWADAGNRTTGSLCLRLMCKRSPTSPMPVWVNRRSVCSGGTVPGSDPRSGTLAGAGPELAGQRSDDQPVGRRLPAGLSSVPETHDAAAAGGAGLCKPGEQCEHHLLLQRSGDWHRGYAHPAHAG